MDSKPKILCVDDRADNLRIRALLLQQFGCDTVTAQDRSSALHAVEENDIDLLLIDYHLAAGETGEEIARDVRAMRPKTPMIMLTGDAKLPETAYECVDEVMIKGATNPAVLLDLIQRLLPNFTLRPRHAMLVAPPKREAS
jgi:CheY-like chemotaxis protein